MENIKEIDIVITLIAGTLVMFLMAGVIVFSVIKYQQKVLKQKEILRLAEKKFQTDLLDATISASEKERETIAKNMHDEIGTLLNVIKLNNTRIKLEGNDTTLRQEMINTNNQLLIEIDENVRTISNDLMSPTLLSVGFIKALDRLSIPINKCGSVNLEVDTAGLSMRFTSKIEIQLFRICKEIINNTIKHSGSCEIKVALSCAADLFTVSLTHNGTGINDADVKLIMEKSDGLGLKSIYSRVQIIDGRVNYFTKPGELPQILIQVPVKNKYNESV